jgi:chromosomal replication initiation ATPase DnaA
MDIKTFVQVVSNLPPDISVLVKGPTGIGKSHIFHQIGEEIGLEVLDRRLSYMTEGI